MTFALMCDRDHNMRLQTWDSLSLVASATMHPSGYPYNLDTLVRVAKSALCWTQPYTGQYEVKKFSCAKTRQGKNL